MKLLFLIFFLGLGIKLSAQINLVPNPSFENFDTCPTSMAQINYAIPWFQPCLLGSSTDYFHSCSTNGNVGVPDNIAGFQYARTGNGYAGFGPGSITGNNSREYLEIELDDTLTNHKKYFVSFYVSFANNSRTSIDRIGALLTNIPIYYSSPPYGVLAYSPQLENPIGNIITDTANWVEISDTIIANGGEKYITIGNFRNDSNTNALFNTYGVYYFSYYYIDDVSVVLCDSTTGIKSLEEFDFNIFPNPTSDELNIRISKAVQKDVVMKLYSSIGHLIFEKPFVAEVDVGDLPKGVYFLVVDTWKGRVVKKVVKW